eukprot:CAMPEP_0117665100 /NCGR_PEP_ID=MMETSP0804-20121206/9616_1 /TAXON_ID=1074897 /ORGANISM="Tetraselmis astigmatica, Strain CCMP880" /LENGTH=221 /DNA_ID=CAMNT_0005472463 /DNA_START=363 /DNA_END=1028 /DNA_ORIENTATION=-
MLGGRGGALPAPVQVLSEHLRCVLPSVELGNAKGASAAAVLGVTECAPAEELMKHCHPAVLTGNMHGGAAFLVWLLHTAATAHQGSRHLAPVPARCPMQRCLAGAVTCVRVEAPLEQLGDDVEMAVAAREVQSAPALRSPGLDICASTPQLFDDTDVSSLRSPEQWSLAKNVGRVDVPSRANKLAHDPVPLNCLLRRRPSRQCLPHAGCETTEETAKGTKC